MTLYSNTAIDNMAKNYFELGGAVHVIEEGSLTTYGHAVFYGKGLKTVVVKEKYLNHWSSAYTARRYNSMPAKYLQIVGSL